MSKRFKVVLDVFSLQYSISGIGTYIRELIPVLKNSDKVDLVILPEGYNLDRIKAEPKYIFTKALRHFLFYHWKRYTLPRKLKSLGPCTLIVPDFVLPSQKFKNVQKIAVIHDDLFWKYPENYNPIWRRWYIRLIENGLTPEARIISTSKFSSNQLSYLFKNKIDYAYQTFKTFATEVQDSPDFNNEQSRYILHVGTFDKRKDILTIVKALKHLKSQNKVNDLKCVLVGEQRPNGHREILDELLLYIQKNNLSDRVILKGYVSKGDLQRLYKDAFCYVFPSKYEGFGIPILESFLFELPVITSNAEALVEIGGNATMKFSIGNSEELASCILKLLMDESYYKSLVNLGKERIKEFGPEKFGSKIIELINPDYV